MTRRGPFWLGCGRIGALLGAAIALALGLFLAFDLGSGHQAVAPQRHTIDVVARRYAFDPPVIHVEKGDEVRLRFACHRTLKTGQRGTVEKRPPRARGGEYGRGHAGVQGGVPVES